MIVAGDEKARLIVVGDEKAYSIAVVVASRAHSVAHKLNLLKTGTMLTALYGKPIVKDTLLAAISDISDRMERRLGQFVETRT